MDNRIFTELKFKCWNKYIKELMAKTNEPGHLLIKITANKKVGSTESKLEKYCAFVDTLLEALKNAGVVLQDSALVLPIEVAILFHYSPLFEHAKPTTIEGAYVLGSLAGLTIIIDPMLSNIANYRSIVINARTEDFHFVDFTGLYETDRSGK